MQAWLLEKFVKVGLWTVKSGLRQNVDQTMSKMKYIEGLCL